jgi:elongation factor P hydroxylase
MSLSVAAELNSRPDPDLPVLLSLFDHCFFGSYNTRLIKGEDEPIYLPADKQCSYHRVIFAHGFFSSALHEVSHWCIAGDKRRQLTDFGYWYAPDGRSAEQQQIFESVEVKPQALEWIFTKAAGRRFHVSADNLSGESSDSEPFKNAVYQQVMAYCQQGLNERSELFRKTLAEQFGTASMLSPEQFHRDEI